ncbi:MAG TPA: hypothetical protein VGB76_23025 [Pyrinomonadaceae bacterium]|jgi:hypothetical protein
MRNNYLPATAKNFRTMLFILLIALTGIQTPGVDAFAQRQTAPTALSAELKSSTEAKRVLANIGSRDFKRIRDARLRAATSRAVDALKAVARNTSAAREAALVVKFNRTVKDLKSLAKPSTEFQECDNQYNLCIEICKEIGSDCDLCGFGQYGCYLNKLAIEMTKDPLDPTP